MNLDQDYHLNILASVYFNDSNSEPFIFEYKPIKFAINALQVISQAAKGDEESFSSVADVMESKNEVSINLNNSLRYRSISTPASTRYLDLIYLLW